MVLVDDLQEDVVSYISEEVALGKVLHLGFSKHTIAGNPNHDLAVGTLNSVLKQAKLKEEK